jgi:hypothetical protein
MSRPVPRPLLWSSRPTRQGLPRQISQRSYGRLWINPAEARHIGNLLHCAGAHPLFLRENPDTLLGGKLRFKKSLPFFQGMV